MTPMKNEKHLIDLDFHRESLLPILNAVIGEPEKYQGKNINKLLHRHPGIGLHKCMSATDSTAAIADRD